MIRFAALATLAHAQLVVDWTAKSTFDHEKGKPLTARCPLYSTVALHRTCLSNANPRSYLTPKDCLPIVRFEEIASDFGLGPSEDKALNNWRRCDLNRSKPVPREDYLLYERLRRLDVRARVDPHAVAANPMYTQVETVVRGQTPRVVGTIYSD